MKNYQIGRMIGINMLTQDKLDNYVKELLNACNNGYNLDYINKLIYCLKDDCEELLEIYKDICYDYREYAERRRD